jgi:malate/lactate dehydrogenase
VTLWNLVGDSFFLSEQAFTQEEIEKLTNRIQYGGDEVVKAKGTGDYIIYILFFQFSKLVYVF